MESEKNNSYLRYIWFILLLITSGVIIGLLIWIFIHPSDLSKQIEEIIAGTNQTCELDSECENGYCYINICRCDDYYWGPYCNQSCDMDSYCLDDECCGEHGECSCGKCFCFDGWEGEHCEVPPICPNITEPLCEAHEDCINGLCYIGICRCDSPNYWGDLCELVRRDLSYCISSSECLNGGLCIDNIAGHGECYCLESTIGNNCEVLI